MAKFPNWGVGLDVSATNLANGIPNIVTKASANTITSNATLANDAELQNIALEVGTWEIETELFVTGIVAVGFKNAWAFSGTVTGSIDRAILGPTAANTVAAETGPVLTMRTALHTASIGYGIVAGTGVAYWIREFCPNFVVATAGNFAVQVAQSTSSATSTVLKAASRVKVRRIV